MSSFCTAKATHIFSAKNCSVHCICISLYVNFNESLTNDIISFEQLGPEWSKDCPSQLVMPEQTADMHSPCRECKVSICQNMDFFMILVLCTDFWDYLSTNFKCREIQTLRIPGPSCSKLTTSLVKDSLKFTSSDTQICWNFLLKKCE